MECPNCGLFNPPTAQRCDCGFDFPSQTVRGSLLSRKELRNLAADPYGRYGTYRVPFVQIFGWLQGLITGETDRRRKLEEAYRRVDRFGPPES